MELIILGSGTFVPEKGRRSASHLVRTQQEHIVLDFGRGAIDSLLELGVNPLVLNAIFLSHLHADHAAELVPYIQLVLDTPDRYTAFPKHIYGPPGIRTTAAHILRAFHLYGHKHLDRLQIHEISNGDQVSGSDWEMSCCEITHDDRITSLCLTIHADEKKLVYSGDSAVCPTLSTCCQDAEVALLEATLPLRSRPAGHLSGDEVGKLAARAKVKRVVATHVAGSYLKGVVKDIRRFFAGEVLVATDLLHVSI